MKFSKLFFLIIISILIFISCKKNDISSNSSYVNEEKFFLTKNGADPLTGRIIGELKLQTAKNPNLIEVISAKHGYPLWDKIRKVEKRELEYFGEAAIDTIVYIPLAPEGDDKVSAFFYVVLKGTISIQLYNKYDYEQFGFDTLVTTNSHNLALQFMILDYLSFGHKDFKILDERLLKDFDIHPDIPIEDRTVHIDNLEKTDLGRGWEYWSVEICTKTRYLECSSPGRCCSDGSCSGCLDGGCWKTKLDCKKSTIAVYNDGGNSGGGGTTPSGGGGGGGNPGSIYTTPQQCNPTPEISNGLPPCVKGNSNGWIALELEPVIPIDKYNCTYQLSEHDKEVFEQIDQEDAQSDLNHQNLDCQGTKRTGNIFFQGTKEHWLIQLDYVSKNPAHGEIEYAIPNSSAAGNRGYADIVNLQTKAIFEIKPNNVAGQTNGAREVANYVAKANIYCSTFPPYGVFWNPGSSFSSIIIPTSIPNQYLEAKLIAPGVIGYTTYSTTNPVALPITVPASAISKLKHLIERLKLNFENADEIIAEYLKNNQGLATFIKGTAIGAGVAIIVGTILEDVITAGAGIADDWACFVLAHRIIRFAKLIP